MSNDERVSFLGAQQPEGALWSPVPGVAVQELGRTLQAEGEISAESFAGISAEATRVLSQAAPPTGDRARRTGLVVGFVQSGKTMSMTTVAALARDNGFRMVIVFAGVTRILLSQTRERFQGHLQPPGQYPEQWRILDSENPRLLRRAPHELRNLLATWQDDTIPDDRKPALLVTVMKNHRHLDALRAFLSTADLTGIPVLVLDDEADQAGLNTQPDQPRASSTHRHIAAVRACLPHHTYLQYTATPQAPLLISLIDMLSPEFAEVLEAGHGYTGGEAFFSDARRLAQPIANDELFTPGDPPAEPPEGLVSSLQQFFVIAAAFGIEGRMRGPWSMLVHPSMRQADHAIYFRWAQRLQEQWREELALPRTDPDRQALVADFRAAYAELARTDDDLPAFPRIEQELRFLVGRAVVTELNSDSGNEVHWNNGFAHVLVGGEKLNRGFTVKGLCCTYMPRGPGGWNADTIQQRARFFGYKARYLDRCRVYLHPQVLTAYRDYVEHEVHVRDQLRAFRGQPLAEWKRAFFMDGALRPTRNGVLSDPYYRVRQRSDWFFQLSPHDEVIREGNTALVDQLLARLELEPFWDDGRHMTSVLPLAQLQGELLVPVRAVGHRDIRWMYAARVWVDALLEQDPTLEARIIFMDAGRPTAEARIRRRGTSDGMVRQLPQGRDHEDRGTYPGDRAMADTARVTLQVHRLRVVEDESEVHDVCALALRIPRPLSNVIVQPGGPA